jgi:hypothetical protein
VGGGQWRTYLVDPDPNRPEVRFILDNNVDEQRLGNLMRGYGISVTSLPTTLRHHPAHRADPNISRHAKRADRLLITHDEGFLDFEEHPPETNSGVVIIPGGSGDVEDYLDIIGTLFYFISLYPDEFLSSYTHLKQGGTFDVHYEDETTGEIVYERFRVNDGDIERWEDDEETAQDSKE